MAEYLRLKIISNLVTRIILRPLSALSLDNIAKRNVTTGFFGLVISPITFQCLHKYMMQISSMYIDHKEDFI